MEQSKCGVCYQQGHGLHFGIIACRACSSFFRRSVAERKVYKCRMKEECLIKQGLRNTCRACRFKKCVKAGMRMDVKQNQALASSCDDTNSPTDHYSEPSSSNPPSRELVAMPNEWRTLNEVLQAVHSYKSSDKSLFTVNHPDQIFGHIKYTAVNERTHKEIVKSSISLLYSMLNEHIRPFSTFSSQEKIDILRSMYHEFHLLYQTWQTQLTFGIHERKFFLQYGYYLSLDFECYYENKNSAEQAKKLFSSLLDKIMIMVRKVQEMAINETELSFLIGAVFCQTVERLGMANEIMMDFKDRLYGDFNIYMVDQHGVEKGGTRGFNIFALMIDTKTIAFNLSESFAVAKVFIPEFNEYWDQTINSY